MRRKSWLYGAAIMALSVTMMTACGDGGSEQAPTLAEEPLESIAEPALSETESEIRDLELRYSSGEFSQEDYHALAKLYREEGRVLEQRNLLEQSYRLYDDAEAFEILQTISVNLEEEEESVQKEASTMLMNLELEEYLDESINLVSSDEWISTMMPKLYEGKRNYFMLRDGKPVLMIQAGYEENRVPSTNVWFVNAENQVTLLQRNGDTVQMLRTGLENGVYQGEFEAWLCDGSTGDIYHEQGTFANGILTGDYTASIHVGKEASEVYSLWSNREGMEYSVYNGNFDAQGVTTLEQPTEKQMKALLTGSDDSACVVYAYDANKGKCLFRGLPEGVEPTTYAFRTEALGWESYPTFETYDAEKQDETKDHTEDMDGEASEDTDGAVGVEVPEVRVFDGEIQVWQNGMWISAGKVEQYVDEDPFREYAEGKKESADVEGTDDTQEGNGEAGSEKNANEGKRVTGTIQKEKPKPSNPKPNPQPQPEQPAQPEQPKEPEKPADPKPSNPNPNPQPKPEPPKEPEKPAEPEQPAPPADNGGNDTDIEWSDDIL